MQYALWLVKGALARSGLSAAANGAVSPVGRATHMAQVCGLCKALFGAGVAGPVTMSTPSRQFAGSCRRFGSNCLATAQRQEANVGCEAGERRYRLGNADR